MVKKNIISFFLLMILVACAGNSKEGKNESGTDETAISASNDPVYQKGLELVARNNCLTCHKVDDVFTGPSYRQIAKRYKGASATAKNRLEVVRTLNTNGIPTGVMVAPIIPGLNSHEIPDIIEAARILLSTFSALSGYAL